MYFQLRGGFPSPHEENWASTRADGPIFHALGVRFQVYSSHIRLAPTEDLFFYESWIYYDGWYWTELRYLVAAHADMSLVEQKLVEQYSRTKATHPSLARVEVTPPEHKLSKRFTISR